MTDTSYAPSIEDGHTATPDTSKMFYVVSRRKLAILFIATLGMYGVYWFYKNWAQYRDNRPAEMADGSIWPVPRAIFLIFFVHSLFGKVQTLGRDKPEVAAWGANGTAWLIVVTYIAMNVADLLERRSIGLPYVGYFGFVGLLLLVLAYRNAQTMINATCGDPEGKSNNQLTGANYVWIVIGLLIWIGSFMSGFMGSAPVADSTPSF